MKKNTCPHCGAWNQLSKFCQRCGATIVYSSVEQGSLIFKGKQVAKSTQGRDMTYEIIFAMLITFALLSILVWLV